MAFAPPAAGNPIAALIARAQAAHAALSGGAPGAPAGMQAPGAPAGMQAPGGLGGGGQGPDNAAGLVNKAAQLIQQAIGVERDPVERAGLAKIQALLHGFAATEQKQKDAAMGAGPAIQMIRRTAQ